MGMSDFYGPADEIARRAWALSRGEDIVPLIGARRRDRLTEALQALDLQIDLERIEAAIPAGAAAGERYPEAQMAHLPA